MKDELYECVKRFMVDNRITCEESISQCDRVIENAYEFIEELFRIIEDDLPKEAV